MSHKLSEGLFPGKDCFFFFAPPGNSCFEDLSFADFEVNTFRGNSQEKHCPVREKRLIYGLKGNHMRNCLGSGDGRASLQGRGLSPCISDRGSLGIRP